MHLFSLLRERPLRAYLLPLLGVLALAIVLGAGSMLLGGRRAAAAESSGHSGHSQSSGIRALTEIPKTAQRVTVGMYPIAVYDLDEETNTYHADAYIWFIWSGDKDPTQTMELVNAVEEWSMVRKNVNPQPVKLPDGRLLQLVHVEGRFFYPFALGRFPLDVHHLPILLEDTFYTAEQLIYEPDQTNSGIGELLRIPGWRLQGWKMEAQLRTYDTNFGDPAVGMGESRFAHLRYELTIGRPLSYFGWKLYLPLVITMLLTWSALLIHPEKVEPRTALPATALLAAVFLQLGYSETLPDVGHLVLMDKIYIMAYVLIIIVLIEAATTARLARHESESKRVARAHRLDRIMLALQFAAFFGGTAYLLRFG